MMTDDDGRQGVLANDSNMKWQKTKEARKQIKHLENPHWVFAAHETTPWSEECCQRGVPARIIGVTCERRPAPSRLGWDIGKRRHAANR